MLTDPALPSGTDRVCAAVKDLDVDVVLNVQGDEPLMDPENIDRVAGFLLDHPEFPLATVALADRRPGRDREPEQREGRARRRRPGALLLARRLSPTAGGPSRASRRSSTSASTATARTRSSAGRRLPPHPLERAESLEQLRALAAGMAMAVLDAASDSIGVDTIGGRAEE